MVLLSTSHASQSTTFSTSPVSLRSPKMLPPSIKKYRCGCPQVRTVDTTGAGDIFGGSAVSRFLELGKTPEQLTQEDLAYMARYASAAASLSTEKSGAIPSIPAKEAVLQKMQEAY